MSDLVIIEDECIVIRIRPDALRHATEHGVLSTFNQKTNDFRKVEVTDFVVWRQAVVDMLNREKENGDTLVHLMLDQALEDAVEMGAEGIRIEGVLP